MYIILGKRKNDKHPRVIMNIESLKKRVVLTDSQRYTDLWGINVFDGIATTIYPLDFTRSDVGVGSVSSGMLSLAQDKDVVFPSKKKKTNLFERLYNNLLKK